MKDTFFGVPQGGVKVETPDGVLRLTPGGECIAPVYSQPNPQPLIPGDLTNVNIVGRPRAR